MTTMKAVAMMFGSAALCAALLAPSPVYAQDAEAEVQVPEAVAEHTWKAEGRVWLEGDSTLHKYTAEARNLTVPVRVQAKAGESVDAVLRSGAMKGVDLVVPVGRLTSGDRSLDKNLRNALKAPAQPNITFKMQGYEVKSSSGGELTLLLRGALTIAGVQKPQTLEVLAKTNGGSAMVLTGSKDLKMTDFGIEPPVMMLGTLKTANEVTVKFELNLAAAPSKRM